MTGSSKTIDRGPPPVPPCPGSGAIVGVRDACSEEWDVTWRDDPSATGFHSRFWAETWAAATGGRTSPAPLVVQFDDGAQVILPLSAQRLRRGLVRRMLSSPAGTYGGWISTDAVGPAHAAALVRHLGDTRGSLVWRVNPFDSAQTNAVKALPVTPEQTLALDLDGGRAALARRWAADGNAVPRKMRAARRAGVQVRPARDLDDWRSYFDVYQATLERWGPRATSRYDWALFAHLAAGDPDMRTLWLATMDDTIIAGALCLAGPRVTSYWHGAALTESLRFRPVNLLMGEIAHDACDRGHRWFDLGPSGDHAGVAKFKRSLGAAPLDCPLVRRVSTAERLSRSLARPFASGALR